MARLWTSAYGLQSNVAGLGDFHQSNGAITVDFIDGKWWHHVTGLSLGTSQRTSHRMVNAAVQGPLFGRGRFKLTTLPAAANRILRWSAGGIPLFVALTAAGNLQLSDETGLIGTSATALTPGSTYVIECEFDSHLGAGACVAILRINGVAEVTATNRTFTSTTVQQFDVGGNLASEAQTVGDWRWTDIAINDTTAGGDQTSWPGSSGQIAYFFPVADGDAASGAARGGVDSGSFFGQVDELPPTDGTDYVELSTTSGVFWVKVTDPDSLGIGGAYIIKLVSVGGRVALASAGAGTWFPSLKSQSGGTVLDGSPVNLALATYALNDDSSGLQQFKVTSYTDPQSGGAWTKEKLETMQIGAKTNDGSPATRVSHLYAIVEYQVFNVNIPSVLPSNLYGGLWLSHGGLS